MATCLYVNPDPVNGPPRATVLGCGWMAAVPAQYAALVAAAYVAPASGPVVILSGAGTTEVIPDNPPTTNAAVMAALEPVLAAEAANAAAAATLATNQATITANIALRQAAIAAWIAANPSGAVLTAAQTLALAQGLNGLCKLLLQEFSSTTGT
jgi:hypothetical protein